VIIAPLLRAAAQSLFRRVPPKGTPVHLLLAVCDHYEPGHADATPQQADQRVETWVREYPRLFGGFRDSDGKPPRHSFFYPIEMYRPPEVERIAELCRAGFGEVEVHLHHDNDTADNLRKTLLDWKELLHQRHGLLARDPFGQIRYGFIHGNWCLDNSRPDGRWCGVNSELDVLRETGCYADFTMPSYPSATQTRKINSIYYAMDDPQRPKSHDSGFDVGRGAQPVSSLLLVQGPLLPNWKSRKFGLLPRMENGNLQGNQPPSALRVDLWLRARVQVPSRPDWFFVKLHTHGAPEWNQKALLGEPMVQFHQALAERAAGDANFQYHYVTAREMYNLIKAAEAGGKGDVAEYRDFVLQWKG
jgi:hypothetical protein